MEETTKNKGGKKAAADKSVVVEPDAPAGSGSESLETQSSSPSSDSPPQANSNQQSGPASRLKRMASFANIYFIIFLVLVLITAGVIFVGLKNNKKSSGPQSSKTPSLTDKQLAELKGSTTIVGNSQQVLDIQGSSIFEGQVLMRNNLDVAGSIKIGGSISLPSITVAGSSSFGQISVSNTLSVNGNTTLQGQLSIQKSLSVAGSASISGALSAGQLNISNLQLTGDLTISHHISLSGGTPGRSNGVALGAGGTASVSGTDTAGTVTINTGSSSPAGCFITINFTQRFNSTPHIVISPSNSSAGALNYYTNRSNTSFSICTDNTPSDSTTYIFDYIAID